MSKNHNKKRNIKFLYELLTRELTRSILFDKETRKEIILGILREFFQKDLILAKELECYEEVLSLTPKDSEISQKILEEIKKKHDRLDEEEVYKAQTKLIKRINKLLGTSLYSQFVPNYRSYATINQIFSKSINSKKRVLLEQQYLQEIKEQKEKKQIEPMDSLSYKMFFEKFNQKYSSLLKEQVQLLSKYILSFSDEETDYKVYLNEEIGRLRSELEKQLNILKDEELKEKSKKIINILKEYREISIKEVQIEELLKIQQLVNEMSQ